jgi:hypothetical protein
MAFKTFLLPCRPSVVVERLLQKFLDKLANPIDSRSADKKECRRGTDDNNNIKMARG